MKESSTSTQNPPAAHLTNSSPSEATIAFSGDWISYGTCPDWRTVLPDPLPAHIRLADDGITSWNTAIVTFIFCLTSHCRSQNCDCNWSSLPNGIGILLNLAFAVPEKKHEKNEPLHGIVANIGYNALALWKKLLEVMNFLGQVADAFYALCRGRSRVRLHDVLFQCGRCGHQAIPIISALSMLIGVILGFIGCIPLRMFGAEVYVATLVGIGVFRMMAATTVGMVMAGRTGAAFAAELGSMQVNEEIDSYIAMGLSPIEILVLPRFLGLSLTMPLLCIYSDLMGLFGGLLVGMIYSRLGCTTYLQHMFATTDLHHFFIGVFTSWVFGLLISLCGCYHGLKCGRNSTAVGQAATSAVVSAIVCMVVSIAFITIITVLLGY